ncbi:MAG: site-specific integrase, partial [Acidobacteria bacterium]|nr:site-specific integrase [Acidobacteriota bacterium]
MAVFKRGKKWWYKFVWNGELIRESTKQSNKRTAEQMEAAHKASLAKGEVG